jgi:hypothetical protein
VTRSQVVTIWRDTHAQISRAHQRRPGPIGQALLQIARGLCNLGLVVAYRFIPPDPVPADEEVADGNEQAN